MHVQPSPYQAEAGAVVLRGKAGGRGSRGPRTQLGTMTIEADFLASRFMGECCFYFAARTAEKGKYGHPKRRCPFNCGLTTGSAATEYRCDLDLRRIGNSGEADTDRCQLVAGFVNSRLRQEADSQQAVAAARRW